MMRTSTVLFLVLFIFVWSCTPSPQQASILSPDGELELRFSLSEAGQPQFTLHAFGKTILVPSELGYRFERQSLDSDFEIYGLEKTTVDRQWEQPWGEDRIVRDHHSELWVDLKHRSGTHLEIRFRVFNDGVGFRYEFPKQKGFERIHITDEGTRFALTGDHLAWWIPGDHDSYEYLYNTTPLSQVDGSAYPERGDRHIPNKKAVNLPITMKTDSGLFLAFSEANLTDYPDMTLEVRSDHSLKSELVPWSDGVLVKTSAPFVSPWRTIQIGRKAGDLVESKLILNLNEPSKIEDTSWIEPMKYTGIWWEMHIGKTGWGYNPAVEGSYGTLGGDSGHGANTENAKKYIDFNDEAEIRGLLIEGWYTGWEYWGADTLGFFDFVTEYPDFDLETVANYAQEKGVMIVGHHETSGQATNYEKHLEKAFQLYHKNGIRVVKTGYAGAIAPEPERHHGQFMVRHYRKVVETAARFNITIDAHEPIKASGIRRTWPNMMTREGVRGMEYNAWSEGLPPAHTTILPFTRMLAGPIDYTPGIFDLLFDEFRKDERVQSTLANQLALYVVIYSPMQMVSDLPENYKDADRLHPAFKFIQDVPVDWEVSRVLDGEPGEFVIIARKERGGENWYLGAVTDENARNITINLNFLDPEKSYKATIYRDGERAHWKTQPYQYQIDEKEVLSKDELSIRLAAGGGLAISFNVLSK